MNRLVVQAYMDLLRASLVAPLRLRRGDPARVFEGALGRHFGLPHVLVVNSGTSANEAAIAGLGLAPGTEVICPATAPAFVSLPVLAAGCIPVFADVDERTLISSASDIEDRLSPNARAVIVVHLHGQPAHIVDIMELAHRRELQVIEDCAQAYDCYAGSHKVGTFGTVMTSSLHVSKHITCGEGGFVATRNPDIYRRAALYSNAGIPLPTRNGNAPAPEPVAGIETRGHLTFGHNHRMSILQALVGMEQLKRIERLHERRQQHTRMVVDYLSECAGVELAEQRPDTTPNYWMYPLRLKPEITLNAREVVDRVRGRFHGSYLQFHNEVNYLEPAFQAMEQSRRTPFGLPLPEHVHYRLGSCPKAERAASRALRCSVHHLADRAALERTLLTLRDVLAS